MPWTKENPPAVAKNWTSEEQVKCVGAANAVLEDTGDDKKAIFACIHAAGKSKEAMQRASIVSNGYTDFTAAIESLVRLNFDISFTNTVKAEKILKQANALHMAHLDGSEPTSKASQNKLMNLMNQAYAEMDPNSEAGKLMQQAIELHMSHLDDSEPTSKASQKKMMRLMEDALKALGGDTNQLMSATHFNQGDKIEAEIFAVGTWNKIWKFSLKDLKDIAANFATLSENHKVPLKLGHNDAQPFTDGQPALGWVTDVWVSGDKLMARFDNVPAIIRQAFAAKMYRHVSVELDVDVEHKGKKYKYVLSAVALLGADTPAVNTLADLTHYLDGGERLAASRREVFSVINGDREVINNEDTEMTKEELDQAIKAALAPFETKIATFSAENATLKVENEAMKAEKAKQTDEAAKVKIKMHRESLIGKLETAVKDKRLVPAQRESAIKFMKLNDDAHVMGIDVETVDEYIKVNGGKVRMSDEQGRTDGGQQESTDKDPGTEINARAKKLQGENANLTFSAARDRVMEADPELALSWLNPNGALSD